MLTAEKPESSQQNHPKPKRAWVPWYRLPVLPLCEDCGVPCIVGSSPTVDGRKTQHRYCPCCKKPFKTVVSELK